MCVSDCPEWNFDGSSTGQAEGGNSDVFLCPVALFKDPFRRGKNKLLLCETLAFDKTPLGKLFEKVYSFLITREP